MCVFRCAPECISYLRFTSASDVWAYGVTLWEMFSYGFQPWAVLTGHQILEAIDEPNFQVCAESSILMKAFFFSIQRIKYFVSYFSRDWNIRNVVRKSTTV